LVVVGLAVTALGGPLRAASPEPGGTVFESARFPYRLTLPTGWRVVPASQEPGTGADAFDSGEVVATVVSGVLGPGETVADHVAGNRAALAADCVSDAAADRPTTLGDEPAIAWSWRCPDLAFAAIHTAHDGRVYRLAVTAPAARETEAPAFLEALRASWVFVADPGVSPLPGAVDLTVLHSRLQGTWTTEWHPVELDSAAVRAAGLDDTDPAWRETVASMGQGATTRYGVKFADDDITQYSALNGGPLEVGWYGTYRLLDGQTIEATESGNPATDTGTIGRIVYDFALDDDVLTIDVVTDSDPLDMMVQTAIYETLPFTKVP
jgi:hypothetical protein